MELFCFREGESKLKNVVGFSKTVLLFGHPVVNSDPMRQP